MWHVLPHGPIEKIASNLWRVQGAMADIPMKRAMDLVRRPNGEVWIHNPVALDDAAMKEIEAWGAPTVVLVPSGYHTLDAARFKERYPSVRLLCPKGARGRLIAKRIPIDATYDAIADDEDLAIERLDGVRDMEAAIRITSEDGVSLLFCDGVFNMPHQPGFKGWVLKTIGSTGGPRVTNIFKWFVVKDKSAYRASLIRLSEIPNLKRVFLQHEEPFDGATLRRVANGW